MECCGAGDLLVVWKLDRLGRNVMELMGVIERLRRRGAGLKVLTGAASAIDINAAEGQALFAIYAAIAAMELDMNRQRTASGRRAAPQRREIARSGSTEGKRSARRTAHPCLRLAFNGRGRSGGGKPPAGQSCKNLIIHFDLDLVGDGKAERDQRDIGLIERFPDRQDVAQDSGQGRRVLHKEHGTGPLRGADKPGDVGDENGIEGRRRGPRIRDQGLQDGAPRLRRGKPFRVAGGDMPAFSRAILPQHFQLHFGIVQSGPVIAGVEGDVSLNSVGHADLIIFQCCCLDQEKIIQLSQ
jgi:hypothetical protein